MKVRSFIIKITDGRIHFKSEHHKHLFNNWLKQFNDGSYRLEINDIKEKRSDQQNRFYWGVYLPLIAEETGHTTEELHELFRGMFNSEIKEVLGKQVRVSKSTTNMTKGEFVEYIMKIEAQTGILAPSVEEYFGYNYRK